MVLSRVICPARKAANALALWRKNMRSVSLLAVRRSQAPACLQSHWRTCTVQRSNRMDHQHFKSDLSTVLAGVAIVGTVAGVGKMWWDAAASGPKRVDPNELGRDELVGVLLALGAQLKRLYADVGMYQHAIQEELERQGLDASDEHINQLLAQEFPNLMQELERQVFQANGVTPEIVNDALLKYSRDPRVVEVQEELRDILQNNPLGSGLVELPEDLTLEKTLGILTELMEFMETAMEEALNEAKREGIDINKELDKITPRFQEKVHKKTKEVYEKNGVDEQVFSAALQLYGTEERFQKQVEALHMQQTEAFRRMGLNVGEE